MAAWHGKVESQLNGLLLRLKKSKEKKKERERERDCALQYLTNVLNNFSLELKAE